MNQELFVALKTWALTFISYFNAKLVTNFSFWGWVIAVAALWIAYDYSKLKDGKQYRIVGLLHDSLKITFISISVLTLFITAPLPGAIDAVGKAIADIKAQVVDPNPDLLARIEKLSRDLGALTERNRDLEEQLRQAQQSHLGMLRERLNVEFQATDIPSESSVTQIVFDQLPDWPSFEMLRFGLMTGDGLRFVTCRGRTCMASRD